MYDSYNLNPDKKRHRCHIFTYPDSSIGFAEHSAETYDRVDAQLAWSRALDCVKRGFGPGDSWTVSDIEAMWDGYWRRLKDNRARDTTGETLDGKDDEPEDFFHYNPDDHEGGPSLNCIPTNVGAEGTLGPWPRPRLPQDTVTVANTNNAGSYNSLKAFHATTFFPTGPDSQALRLLTRTVGPDRIVDEALLTFSHTAQIPWLLPDVPPTNRHVQVPLVLAGSFCAGGLARLNVYWDQASVLVQVGVLDPGTELPVVAKEGVEGIIS